MADSILTQELVKDLFEYRNGELYWKIARQGIKIGNKAGCVSNSGYLRTDINRKKYLNHRIIFLYHHGYLPKFLDHIDNNKINNRVENLREATSHQNNCNTKTRTDNTSGIKGVCWDKDVKKWRVQLQVNGKKTHIGIYADIELAELVVTEARNKYHGEFAKHQ